MGGMRNGAGQHTRPGYPGIRTQPRLRQTTKSWVEEHPGFLRESIPIPRFGRHKVVGGGVDDGGDEWRTHRKNGPDFGGWDLPENFHGT